MQSSNMKLLDITSSIYQGFPVDPSVIENAVLNFIESQALVFLPCRKSEAEEFLTIVPKIWQGILRAFSYYWDLRGGLRMKLTRSLVEMLSNSKNVKIQGISSTYIVQLHAVIKAAARINFLRVKNSIPGELSLSKLNGILQACLSELSCDLKMFDFHRFDKDSTFAGEDYFKSIARVFWFGGVEVTSIGPNGETEMALLPLLEDKLNSGSMEVDESLFDLYSTVEELWEFFLKNGVVSATQKFNFETQFKALFLKWTTSVGTRLREMITNAVKFDLRITEMSGSSICTSTEDTMAMIRPLFLSKYLSSDLGKRYIRTMVKTLCGAFAFYVDQIHARASANLPQKWVFRMENTWGQHNDAIHQSVKYGDIAKLQVTIKQSKAQGLNLSHWIGATKETRGGVFHTAAKYHNHAIMSLLKEEQCHPNAQDLLQCTCLHTLSRQLMKTEKFGDKDVREFEKFLDALFMHFPDVNVNIVDHTGYTPLRIIFFGTSALIEYMRRKLQVRSNEQNRCLSPVLDIDFCAHVNSINYISMNAPELMQEHAGSEERDNQGDDSIFNAFRTLRKHCWAACSMVLRRAFQHLCSTVITPVLKHIFFENVVSDFDQGMVVHYSNYLIKMIQDQMVGPINFFITEGGTAPVSERVKEQRLKLVRDCVLPEFWTCILETVESFLSPILPEDSLSIPEVKLLQKLVFEVLPQVFAVYDSEREALGLDDNYFKRHAGTNRLKLLFALYFVPVQQLCDLHGKLLQGGGLMRAFSIQPDDVLRIIFSCMSSTRPRHVSDIAKKYAVVLNADFLRDMELCVRFKLPGTERRLAKFADIEELTANTVALAVSGMNGVGTKKGVLYLMSSHLVCECTRHAPTIIKLADLQRFEVDVSTLGSNEKLFIHHRSNSNSVVLALLVKSAAQIIAPSRQAAIQAGNRRVKECKVTADDHSMLKAKDAINKEKPRLDLIKLFLPADGNAGGQNSKTFKVCCCCSCC
jgi:hypothetical protein